MVSSSLFEKKLLIRASVLKTNMSNGIVAPFPQNVDSKEGSSVESIRATKETTGCF